jgi:hypothetical protein
MGKILLVVLVIVAFLVLIPIAAIWSLNTLFPVLAIPITLDTWMAAVVLGGVVGGTTTATFRK